MQRREIELKQQRRWHDLLKATATPLLDDALALGPRDIPDKRAWKKLVQVASFIDYHLRRSGASHDLPNTHSAWIAAYYELREEYLGR